MKIEKLSIYEFLGSLITQFGIQTLILIATTILFGDTAGAVSSLFQMGSAGIAIDTLLQFGFIALLITIIRYLCMSDIVIKKMMVLWRMVIMLFLILLVMVMAINRFGWFPAGYNMPWILFGAMFALSSAISSGVIILRTKLESWKYEKLLAEYQKDHED